MESKLDAPLPRALRSALVSFAEIRELLLLELMELVPLNMGAPPRFFVPLPNGPDLIS
jgi:hypothetical protein